jgi:hypothetical protein
MKYGRVIISSVKYSQPSLSMGSSSLDSTNHESKPLEK